MSVSSATFPSPLKLLDGSSVQDLGDPGQTVQEWIELRYRNEVTQARKTIYVVAPPQVDSRLDFIRSWTRPTVAEGLSDFAPLLEILHDGRTSSSKQARKLPRAPEAASTLDSIISYISAFFTPLPVRPLPIPLKYVPWTDTKPVPQDLTHIGLQTPSSIVGIRTRPCLEGSFPQQLNLIDLLDAAIEILPADAYAMIMLTDFDLYEDDDDDFCCGRAFGGSRVAVVSSARYHPALDEEQEIGQTVAWPASHSKNCEATRKRKRGRPSKRVKRAAIPRPEVHPGDANSSSSSSSSSPLALAISAFAQLQLQPSSSTPAKRLLSLHLFRFLRTAVHELGHCFALDHCTAYACLMQSTTCLSEDIRQPPYLCPNCTSKVNLALRPIRDKTWGKDIDGSGSDDQEAGKGTRNSNARIRGRAEAAKRMDRLGELERLMALRRQVRKTMGFGATESEEEQNPDVDRSWSAWNAWLGGRIDELERERLSRKDMETERVVIVID